MLQVSRSRSKRVISAPKSAIFFQPPERKSLFAFLERKYKVDIGYADEEIDATAADHRIANLLALPYRELLLRIRQVLYSPQGKAIMYVPGFYRSDRHRHRRFRKEPPAMDPGRNLEISGNVSERWLATTENAGG
jgi:hypothetical protein